jgi:hypothetical protein
MVKLDLKDAYLTVGVHLDSQKYLRFIWQGQNRENVEYFLNFLWFSESLYE